MLVVEDQEAVRRFTSAILVGQGYQVLQACNGPDAVALAERYPNTIQLLLTDVILPVMDGRVLADKLRESRPGLAVLYISGYTDDKISQGEMLNRHTAYLPKPFSPYALATKVREALADWHPAG